MRLLNGFLVACSTCFLVVLKTLERIYETIAWLFPPGKTLALATPFAIEREQSGASLDRSLLMGMRHEANVSRRAADRHT